MKTINYDGEDNNDSDDEDDNDDVDVEENDLFIHSFIKKKKSSFLKIFFQFIGAATPAISVWGPVFPLPLRVTTILKFLFFCFILIENDLYLGDRPSVSDQRLSASLLHLCSRNREAEKN